MEKQAMLSDGEFEIMECVWCSDKAPTQTGIMRWVNERSGKNLKVATIATYIRRIMWKGYLEKIDNNDGHPVYKALVSRDEYFERSSREFEEKWGVERILELARREYKNATPEEKEEFKRQLRALNSK